MDQLAKVLAERRGRKPDRQPSPSEQRQIAEGKFTRSRAEIVLDLVNNAKKCYKSGESKLTEKNMRFLNSVVRQALRTNYVSEKQYEFVMMICAKDENIFESLKSA